VGQKGRGGFNRLKVVDIDGLVRYAVEGNGSNVGDSLILLSSDLMTHHNASFPPGSPRQDSILTDVSFRRCRCVVPMFKGPLARTPELHIAAKLYNKGQMRVKHSIGLKKARFLLSAAFLFS
jgi:hypothetical protein